MQFLVSDTFADSLCRLKADEQKQGKPPPSTYYGPVPEISSLEDEEAEIGTVGLCLFSKSVMTSEALPLVAFPRTGRPGILDD